MRIAIVDDDAAFRIQARQTLALVMSGRGVVADVEQFESAEALLACPGPFDMYFLDVVMPGMDGIALARQIRERQSLAPIVFFTTSPDYALSAFSVAACDYVVKPFATEAFDRAFGRALERVQSAAGPVLTLRLAEGVVAVTQADVVCGEASGHYLSVSLADGRSLVVRQTLQELGEKLAGDRRFFRVGRQAIVNFARVTDFGGTSLTLSNGRSISVPRRLRAEARSAFLAYYV